MAPDAALISMFLIHQVEMTWFIHYFAQEFEQGNTTKIAPDAQCTWLIRYTTLMQKEPFLPGPHHLLVDISQWKYSSLPAYDGHDCAARRLDVSGLTALVSTTLMCRLCFREKRKLSPTR